MDVLILAAGKGERLEGIPSCLSKCIVDLDGKPLISYILDAFEKHGLENVSVVVGHNHEAIRKVLGKEVNYIYNPLYSISSLLVSMVLAKEKFYGREFLLAMGDTLFDPDLLEFLEDRDGTTMPVEFRECDEEDAKVIVEDGIITHAWKFVTHNLPSKKASGEFAGFTLFTKESSKIFFDSLIEVLKEKNFGGVHMDVINKMIEKGVKIKAPPTRHKRIEIDFKEDFEKAQEILKELKAQNKL